MTASIVEAKDLEPGMAIRQDIIGPLEDIFSVAFTKRLGGELSVVVTFRSNDTEPPVSIELAPHQQVLVHT